MIIDFIQIQKNKFESLVDTIMADPELYVNFDLVSDFYKVEWLNLLPQGTTWAVSGLDDGAEQFYAVIEYEQHILSISRTDTISVNLLSPIRDAKMK